MKLRFYNYVPEKLAGVLDYDENTKKFSFVYNAIMFESKSFTNEAGAFEDLIFTQKHTPIKIDFTRKTLHQMISHLSKTYNCQVDIPDSTSKAQHEFLNQLIKMAELRKDFYSVL